MSKTAAKNGHNFGLKPYVLIICEDGHESDPQSSCGETEREFARCLNAALGRYFDTDEPVRLGAEIWPHLVWRIPDAVIISQTLPDVDPITLISKLRLSRFCMDIRYFICCEKSTASLAGICESCGIDGMIEYSQSVEESAKRVFDAYSEFLARKEQEVLSNMRSYISDVLFFNEGKLDKRLLKGITETLLEPIGLDPKQKGTGYLQLIIYMKVLGMDKRLNTLYRYTAELTKTSPAAVEKAVRYSIESAWERSSPYMQYYLFGNTVDASKGKPTNSEFIATMVQHFRDTYLNSQPKFMT